VSQNSRSVWRCVSVRPMRLSSFAACPRDSLCSLLTRMAIDPADSKADPNAGFDPGPRDAAERTFDATGNLRLAISNSLVGVKKQLYGKGPVKAKTYINDNYVFSVLEGGLTRNEETLLAAGEAGIVREYRLRFQEAVADTIRTAIEDVTGRKVLAYHSQVVFDPDRMFEIFVLDGPPEPKQQPNQQPRGNGASGPPAGAPS
jgi:uncharacterized protein YbcI